MMEKLKNKKTLLAGGAIVFAIAVLMASLIFLSSNSAQAAVPDPGSTRQAVTPLNADQDSESTPENGSTDAQVNETRIRWNGEKWEYSTDGGKTWTDTPPDGVQVDEDGGLSMWQGEGDIEDFDLDAFMQDVDNMVNDIMSDVNERYGDVMPESSEGGSFFTFGDSIARQVDGVWEFSSDDGETWTNEPPEGLEVSEDGTRFRIGGGEGDINDFDVDAWLEEWYNEWGGYDENDSNGTTGTAQGISI